MAKVIPGPRGWPVIGNLGQIDRDKFHVALYDLKEKYGEIFQFFVFSKRIIVVSDIVMLRKAFDKQEMCHRPENYITRLKYNSGYLDSNYTDDEVALRSSLWKALAAVKSDDILKEYGSKELESFLLSLDEGKNISVIDRLTKTTAKQYAILITGMQSDDGHGDVILEYINSMFNIFSGGKMSLLSMLPWLRYIPGSYKSAAYRFEQARDNLTNTLVADAQENRQPGQECGILQHLIADRQSVDPNNDQTEKCLVACTMDLLFNAVIPTAQNVAFALLQAIKYPEMQKRVHDELDKLGQNLSLGEPQMDKLPYTEAFILECMRYLSMTNISVPHLVSDDTEIDGYLFPKGSVVLGDIFGIHHDGKLWDQPWAFNPNRFLDKEGNLLPKTDPIHKHIVHFSMGMRKCQGTSFALDTINHYVIGLLARYNVLPAVDSELPSNDPRDYHTNIVINVPDFQCRLEKRSC